jgi:hypothetical protein
MDAQHAEPTVEEILARAAEAGLRLTEDEARQLQPGVRRIRAMAEEVRAFVTPDVEPSANQVLPRPAAPRPGAG